MPIGIAYPAGFSLAFLPAMYIPFRAAPYFPWFLSRSFY